MQLQRSANQLLDLSVLLTGEFELYIQVDSTIIESNRKYNISTQKQRQVAGDP